MLTLFVALQMSTCRYGLSVVGVQSQAAPAQQLPSPAPTLVRASSDLVWDGGPIIRDASRSPSESNSSSAEWPPYSPPTSRVDPSMKIMTAYALLSSEEESAARTGDHPKRQSHPSTTQHVQQIHIKSVVDHRHPTTTTLAPFYTCPPPMNLSSRMSENNIRNQKARNCSYRGGGGVYN